MSCSFGLSLFSMRDNNTKDIIDRLERFRSSYEPYHGYVCIAICVFGILTNFINVIVLTKRQMRTSINVLLTGIAVCDMGTMASYLVYIIHFVFANQYCNPFLYSYAWMLFLFCHIILSVALHTTGLWLAVVMAFVRNMTLRKAMNGSKWLRSKNTWKICLCVYACVFVLCAPSAFGNSIVEYRSYFNDTCGHRPGLAVAYEGRYISYTVDILESRCPVFIITVWLTGTLFKIIPCLFLAVLITSLLWTIKKADRRRRALFEANRARHQFAPPQQRQSAITSDRTSTMLVVILCLFLLTELPQGAISILSGIYVADMRQFVYPNVGDILDLLSLINSSVNFVLYCAMSSKYRQVFWQVVLPRKMYIAWFLRPRTSAMDPSQTACPSHALDRRPTRPQLQLLANMANTMKRRSSEQETTILELFRSSSARCSDLTAVSETDEPASESPTASLRRPKTCDLRRHALTRAAVLAATPAMAQPGEDVEEYVNECVNIVITTPSSEDPPQNPSNRTAPPRRRWLISCSCLCKCACRKSRVEANGQPTNSEHTDAIAAIDSSDRPPLSLWRRCPNTSHKKKCVFV